MMSYAPTGAGSTANGGAARNLLLSTLWSALGQQGQAGDVRDIASTLASRLSAGFATGQNLAPSLAKIVNDALGQVAQQLSSQGVDADSINRLMSHFRARLSKALDDAAQNTAATPAVSVQPQTQTSSTGSIPTGTSSAVTSQPSAVAGLGVSAKYIDVERASISILTQEGDRVTIGFQEVDGASTNFTTDANGIPSSARVTSLSGASLRISVQGNLNSDELQAIGNVLSQVESLAQQFFSGDTQGAFSAAANLGADPREIAGLSLQMTYTRASLLTANTAAQPLQPTVSTPANSTDGSGASVAGVASSGSSISSAPADAASASSASTATDGTAPTTNGTSALGTGSDGTNSGDTAAAGSNTPAASPLQSILSFLQDALAKLAATGSSSSAQQVPTGWKLHALAHALHHHSSHGRSAGVQLAAASLRSLAAQWSQPAQS